MTIVLPVISKLLSESLLSLYPVFVKNIQLPLDLQLWSRLLIYVIVSFLFSSFGFLKNNLFKWVCILLSIINFIHIYTSYRGFQLLESGVSYTLFYTYPIIIILLSQTNFNFETILAVMIALIGVYLISSEDTKIKTGHENFEEKNEKEKINHEEKREEEKIENYKYEGYLMIFLAALTEALIYFQVRKIKTDNNWNHVFISYFLGAVFISLYFVLFRQNELLTVSTNTLKTFSLSMIINAVIGSFGYYLRFYATSRLGPILYSILSYFGIVMSFVYGIIFNKDIITMKKIIGAIMIMISNFVLIRKI